MKNKGFTLIELLVVMTIMGMLTMLAIASYGAVQRGMKQRGSLDIVKGIVALAQQRANIERAPTQIYLFNELVKPESNDDPAVVSGVAVAVCPMGRITGTDGGLFDEFSDPDQSFPLAGNGSASAAMRLYNMRNGGFANVAYGVICSPIDEEDPQTGRARRFWRYGYQKTGGDASFSVGDAYGREFAIIRLPTGYVFSSNPKTGSNDLGWQDVGKPLQFNPDDNPESVPGVTVYERQADGSYKSIGSTSEVKD